VAHAGYRPAKRSLPEPLAPTILDPHCHTVHGSVDSQLTPEQLVAVARQTGLTACCITEHNTVWDRHEAERQGDRWGLPFILGMEVSTDLGHIVVYGLGQYVSGIHDAVQLRRAVEEEGGIMIAAHPFRNLYKTNRFVRGAADLVIPSVDEAAAYPLFALVDEIEVFNAGTGERENQFAWEVAQALGFRGVGSSDAHSTHGIGRFVTVFEQDITAVGHVVDAIRSRRYFPARLIEGRPSPIDGLTAPAPEDGLGTPGGVEPPEQPAARSGTRGRG